MLEERCFSKSSALVAAKRPRAVLLENVANYARHQNGDTLKRTVDMLEEEGYRVSHAILNASDFGVPQARRRLYIVGLRSDVKSEAFEFPKSSDSEAEVAIKDILLSNSKASDQIIDRNDIRFDEKKTRSATGRPLQIGTINKGRPGRAYLFHRRPWHNAICSWWRSGGKNGCLLGRRSRS